MLENSNVYRQLLSHCVNGVLWSHFKYEIACILTNCIWKCASTLEVHSSVTKRARECAFLCNIVYSVLFGVGFWWKAFLYPQNSTSWHKMLANSDIRCWQIQTVYCGNTGAANVCFNGGDSHITFFSLSWPFTLPLPSPTWGDILHDA